jgi:hypothetical protein
MTWIDNLVNRMAEEEIMKAKDEALKQAITEESLEENREDPDGDN